MKKLIMTRLGGLTMAFLSVFAGTSAFADVWFENSVAETLGTGWTVPSGSWTWKSTYGEFSNFNEPLVFEASAKTLPQDIATISTLVKFTALDIAELADPPAGVKAGLTVVEEQDNNVSTYSYYGIVSGKWQKMTAATPVLTEQVSVTITLSKNNNNVTVCYKVGETSLYDGQTSFGSGATATINTVSYVGRCELASLCGAAVKSVFNLTVPAIENAVATVKTNSVSVTAVGGVYPIESGTGPIVISYAPVSSDYMLVGDTTEKTISDGLTGDTVLTAAADFNNLQSKLIVAKIGDTPYPSVQAAVDAAVAPATNITLVADSTNAVEIGKAVTFSGADKVVGDITLADNSELTIEKGKYGDIYNAAVTNLILKGGFYEADATNVQYFCEIPYFAETVTTAGVYVTQVTKGEVFVPSSQSDVPVIAVPADFFPSEVTTAEEKEDYLAEEQQNGQPRWVNYALGIDGTDENNGPKLGDAGDANTVVVDLMNGLINPGAGITAELQVKSGDSWSVTNGVIELDDSMSEPEIGEMRLVLKDANNKETVPVAVTYGLKKAQLASKLEVISVPFRQLGASNVGLPISQILKLKNLTVGDKIYRYNATAGGNETWTLQQDGTWAGETDPAVNPGEGLWLERQDNTGDIFFFGGYGQNERKATPVQAGNWGLVANPNLTKSLPLADITDNDSNLEVTFEMEDGPKVCTYDAGTGWGYTTVSNEVRIIKGTEVTIERSYRAAAPLIAPGKGFWVNNTGTGDAELNWSPDKK